MVYVAGFLLLVAAVVFVSIALAVTALWQRFGRATADALLRGKWRWSNRLGSSIDRSVQNLEQLPEPPAGGAQHYVVRYQNARQRVAIGWPAALCTVVLLIAGSVVAVVLDSNDDDPPSRPFVDNSPGYVNDDGYSSDDDSGYDDGYIDDDGVDSCVGDCNDMDSDGRTWDDVDADHDGLYETP